MNKIFTIVLILVLVGGVAFILSQSNSGSKSETTTKPVAMEQRTDKKPQAASKYLGTVLAGSTTPYLEFTRADYETAKNEGKLILLNFYADWCPICRAEEPDAKAAFDSLQNANAIGFRVNYNDDNTDSGEKAFAKALGVTYQHTKVILKDGKVTKKETAQWSKEQFVNALER